MKTEILLIFVAMLSSCGRPDKSKLNQIHGNPDVPDWNIVSENEVQNFPTYNIFSLNVNRKKIATGFILSKRTNQLIT